MSRLSEALGDYAEWLGYGHRERAGAWLARLELNRPELDSYAVPIGNFEPGHDFEPQFSVYEDRQLPWVCILGEAIERYD